MPRTSSSHVDYNLFVVFDAIYAEGSVTRASERLRLSQPAVSHALNRLRELLDDPLFERQGHTMVPTPTATQLIGDVREALGLLDASVAGATRFDAAESTKRFTIGMRNHLEPVLLPGLTRRLRREAPGVMVHLARSERREMVRDLVSGSFDVAIDVLLPLDDSVRHERLQSATSVVALRADHPLLAGEPSGALSLDDYVKAEHIQVSGRRHGMSLEDFELSRQGRERTIRARCQSYAAAWRTAAVTDLLLTIPEPYIDQLALPDDEMAIVGCPAGVPDLEWHLYWHAGRDQDPANMWLRDQIRAPESWSA